MTILSMRARRDYVWPPVRPRCDLAALQSTQMIGLSTDAGRRYEALRADRIRRARFEARREIITDTLSLAIAVALFAFHWRWLRRRAGPPGVQTGPP